MHATYKDIVFDILWKGYWGFSRIKDIVYDILAYQNHLWGSSSCTGDSWHVDSTARGLGSPKANSVWISKRYASKAGHRLRETILRVDRGATTFVFRAWLQSGYASLACHCRHPSHDNAVSIWQVQENTNSATSCKGTAMLCHKPHHAAKSRILQGFSGSVKYSLWYRQDTKAEQFSSRCSFSPFPEYHKQDTIIRTFKLCSGHIVSGSPRMFGPRKPY